MTQLGVGTGGRYEGEEEGMRERRERREGADAGGEQPGEG